VSSQFHEQGYFFWHGVWHLACVERNSNQLEPSPDAARR